MEMIGAGFFEKRFFVVAKLGEAVWKEGSGGETAGALRRECENSAWWRTACWQLGCAESESCSNQVASESVFRGLRRVSVVSLCEQVVKLMPRSNELPGGCWRDGAASEL